MDGLKCASFELKENYSPVLIRYNEPCSDAGHTDPAFCFVQDVLTVKHNSLVSSRRRMKGTYVLSCTYTLVTRNLQKTWTLKVIAQQNPDSLVLNLKTY